MKIGVIVAMTLALLGLGMGSAFPHTTESWVRQAAQTLTTAGCISASTGAIECSQGIGAGASSNPCIKFNDSDAASSDTNAQVCVNCTDTGDGTEDCDITISQEIAGTMTDVYRFDASSNADATIRNLFTASFDGIGSSQAATRMAIAGGAFGPAVLGYTGSVGNVRCVIGEYSTTGTTAPSAITCTAGTDCITVEVFKNNADPSGNDCVFDDNDTTCTIGAGVTFSAMDRIELRISSGAGLSATTREVVCTVHGRPTF